MERLGVQVALSNPYRWLSNAFPLLHRADPMLDRVYVNSGTLDPTNAMLMQMQRNAHQSKSNHRSISREILKGFVFFFWE